MPPNPIYYCADPNLEQARRLPPRHAPFNRRNRALTQVLRIGSCHPCWPPSPASILNHFSGPLGIPNPNSARSNFALVASRKAAGPQANRLLSLLPPRDYQRLRPHLQPVALEYRQSLYRARKPIDFVYFIETGVGSLVNTMANGEAAEVGTIGNEGIVGLPLLLGDDRAPTSVYVQVPGSGLRMTAAHFSKELARKRLDADGDASLRPCLLQSGRAIGRLQPVSLPGAALRALAADDA